MAQLEQVYSTFGEKMAKNLVDVITCAILNAFRDELDNAIGGVAMQNVSHA